MRFVWGARGEAEKLRERMCVVRFNVAYMASPMLGLGANNIKTEWG